MAAALHVGKLPTAVPVLRDAFQLTVVQAGFLLSLVQLAGMLLGLVAGLAAEAWGRRRTMAAGLTLLGLASIAGAFAQDFTALLVLRAAEGAGLLYAATPAPALIRQNVADRHLDAALGAWGAYMPLGTATALLCGPWAMQAIGWQAWWVVLGGIAIAAAALVVIALPATPPRHDAPAWQPLLATTLRAPGPWVLAASFCVYSAQWLAVVGFLPMLYAEAGWSLATAGGATAFAALVNVVGNLGAGRLLQAGVRATALLAVGFITMAAGAALAFAPEGLAPAALRYAGVIAFSMVGGLIPGTLFATSILLAPGRDTVSVTVGLMQQLSSIGQFAGPPAVAFVAGRLGHWGWSSAVTGACAACGLLLAWRMAGLLRNARS
jgi:MFS family permease